MVVKGGWMSRTDYHAGLTGKQVCENIEMINASEYMEVIATQIFQVQNGLFDVFIHYKEKIEPGIKINL